MVTFGVSTKSYQTATLNMVTLFFMIMAAFIEIIMPHLISTSYVGRFEIVIAKCPLESDTPSSVFVAQLGVLFASQYGL